MLLISYYTFHVKLPLYCLRLRVYHQLKKNNKLHIFNLKKLCPTLLLNAINPITHTFASSGVNAIKSRHSYSEPYIIEKTQTSY